MKTDKHLLQRDAKKLALTNNARMKRMARRKLENQVGEGRTITDEMVTSAITQRSINQIDELSRRNNNANQFFNKQQFAKKKADPITLGQLPTKPLKRNVVWLSLPQQEANAKVSLTTELECFAKYVQLDEKEEEARVSMLLDIQDAVQSKFATASISQFGSHPVGLSIFLSDLDISVDRITADSQPLPPIALALTPAHKKLSNTALVGSVVRRDSFGSNMSDGTIKRASSLVDNPISKRIKFSDTHSPEQQLANESTTQDDHEAMEEDVEVTWSIDNAAGDAAKSSATPTTNEPNVVGTTAETVSLEAHNASMATRKGPKEKRLSSECFDSSDDSDSSDSDYAEGLSEPDEESVHSALHEGETHSEDDYFEEILDGDDEHLDALDDQSFLEDGEMSEEENEEFEGFAEPLQISRTPSSSSLRFDENGEVISIGTFSHTALSGSSSEKKVKLPLDIDVPFWDGANSVNAAQHDSEGVLDEALAENLYKMDGSAMKAVRMSEQEARKEKLEILAKLYKTIKSMAWVQRIEFRKHARVPILNLTHKNGVECDVSLDMSQQATSLVVRALLQRCGPALAKLSAFLKIYLNQLGLDAPFTGGLGSYKLYILLARHIEREPELAQKQDLGPLLVSFLKHYSHRKNLHEGTVVEVAGAEAISFDRTQKVNQLRLAFEKAFLVLTKAHIERPAEKNTHSYLERQLSNSQLGTLLNTEHLSQSRMLLRSKCHKYPHRSEAERDAVARRLLLELHNRVADAAPIAGAGASLEEVKATNPALAARLRSFPSASSAVSHLAGVQANLVETKRGKEMQDIQDLMMGVERPAPSSDPAVAAPAAAVAVHVKLTKTKFIQLPAGSPLQGLEKDCPIFTIQDNKVAQTNKTFHPHTHPKIITGQTELPPGMKVPDDVKKKLPDHLQRALGPFRMMCVADTYLHKTYGELLAMKEKQAAVVEKVRVLEESGFFVKCAPAEKDFLRKMVVANLISEYPGMKLDLTKVQRRLQDETREAQVMIRLYMASRMPTLATASVSATNSNTANVSAPVLIAAPMSSSAAPSNPEVTFVDLTETAPDCIPEGSPLFSIQHDFLLFDMAELGETKFIEKIYATYSTHADLSQAMLRQSLAAGKVKSLFATGYFKRDCVPAEFAFLRKSVLTHLVGEKYDMNLKLTKEERQLICDSAEAHKRVQEYLQYLSQVAQGQAVQTPQEKLEAELKLPFNPNSKVGMQIRQGKQAVPVDMVVEPQNRRFLPRVVNQRIDIFRTLAEADSVSSLSLSELEALQVELLNRKKPYQKEFDDQNWDFFGKNDAERYPILDALIAENVIAEPHDWTFTKEMRNRQKKILEREAAFQKLLSQRRAEDTTQNSPAVPVSAPAVPVVFPPVTDYTTQEEITRLVTVVAGEGDEEGACGEKRGEMDVETGKTEEEASLHGDPSTSSSSSSPFANCSALMREIGSAIPLLVIFDKPHKFDRFKAARAALKEIRSGAQSLHPHAVVDDQLLKEMPREVTAALGPFRMMCIANYCKGKSFEELIQQGDAEYQAVLRLKQLYESSYFKDCDNDDMFFFRSVCITSLLSCSAIPLRRDQLKVQREAERASRAIVRYANSLCKDKSYPAYESRYPVVVEVSSDELRSSIPESEAVPESAQGTKVFVPFDRAGKDIVEGKSSLPLRMSVPPTQRYYLPASILEALGPFPSLEEKAKFMNKSVTELRVYQAKIVAKKALIQKKFDEEHWSYFGNTPKKIENSIDSYIMQGLLELPAGRTLTEAQARSRNVHLQLQSDLQELIEKRLEDLVLKSPTEASSLSVSQSSTSVAAKGASQGKDLGPMGHIVTLLVKRKAEEVERSKQHHRQIASKQRTEQKAERLPQAQPIVISGLAKPVTKPASSAPSASTTTADVAAGVAVSTASDATSSTSTQPASAPAVVAESMAAKLAARALITQRLAEERARALKNKRAVEPPGVMTETAPASAKKAKVNVEVAPTPAVPAVPVVSVPHTSPNLEAESSFVLSPVAPGPTSPTAPSVVAAAAACNHGLPSASAEASASEEICENDEGDCSEFPSLSKPVVLSGRRGPGRRGSFPLTVSSSSVVSSPAPENRTIVQESKNIVQEIDEIKQKLDESKRRHSLA